MTAGVALLPIAVVLLAANVAHAQGPTAATPTAPLQLTTAELEAARAGAPYRQLTAWLAVFNSGDRARLGEFMTRNWPTGNLDREMAMRQQSGGFELRALHETTATTLTGFIEARDSDDFARFSLAVEQEGDHRITRLSRTLIARPPGFDVPRMSESEIVAGLRGRLDRDVQADRFAGAVLIMKKDEVLFRAAHGLANREDKVPNTLDTRFRIGSMNKMFTSVAVLQLVESGKISLSDPLGKFLADYPNRELARKVTIHHLLTHTGGTGDIFGAQFDAHRLELRTPEDYVALYGERALRFEPGARWEYSNYGMVLLGAVIERVTGQDYFDYVARKIFEPAKMNRTGSEPESVAVAGRSVGYTRPPGNTEWIRNTDTLPYRGTPAGGGYSTVGDLVRFAEALIGHELLNAEHTELLITGKVDLPGNGGIKYAYGFEDTRKPDGSGSIGHGGGAPGMNGQLRIFPQSGYVVAVLCNLDPPSAQRVATFLDLRLER